MKTDFYVKDIEGNFVPAKYLEIDGRPVYNSDLLLDRHLMSHVNSIFDADGALLMDQNMTNRMIVPANFEIDAVIDSASRIAEYANQIFGVPDDFVPPSISNNAFMTYDFFRGQPLDLQRTYVDASGSMVRDGPFVQAFTDATSLTFGLVSYFAGIPLQDSLWGGGMLNELSSYTNSSIDLSGDIYGNTLANAVSIPLGYELGQYLDNAPGSTFFSGFLSPDISFLNVASDNTSAFGANSSFLGGIPTPSTVSDDFTRPGTFGFTDIHSSQTTSSYFNTDGWYNDGQSTTTPSPGEWSSQPDGGFSPTSDTGLGFVGWVPFDNLVDQPNSTQTPAPEPDVPSYDPSGYFPEIPDTLPDDPVENDPDEPVVLDLDGNGIRLTQQSSSVNYFDMAGDGKQHLTAWAAAGDGVLAIDANGDGKIDQKSEIDFTAWDTTASTEMQALQDVFDTNHNGKLDTGDSRFSYFKVLVTQADGTQQLKSLSDLGINSIHLISNNHTITLPDGSSISGTAAFQRNDGTTDTAADVSLAFDKTGVIISTAISHTADGSTVVDTKASTDGALKSERILTSSADGLSRTLTIDADGEGVIDQRQTNISIIGSDGSRTEVVSDFIQGARSLPMALRRLRAVAAS